MCSLLSLEVTLRAERGTTPTMLKMALEGFQHLEQPQAWLCAMFELRETVTGEVLQWQESLPPEKEEEPAVIPLLMRGWRLNDILDSCDDRSLFFVDLLFWVRGSWVVEAEERVDDGREGKMLLLLTALCSEQGLWMRLP